MQGAPSFSEQPNGILGGGGYHPWLDGTRSLENLLKKLECVDFVEPLPFLRSPDDSCDNIRPPCIIGSTSSLQILCVKSGDHTTFSRVLNNAWDKPTVSFSSHGLTENQLTDQDFLYNTRLINLDFTLAELFKLIPFS